MTALTLRDVEAADRLALARRDDDGAPAAVTSVVSPRSAKNAGIPVGTAGAPAAIPGGLPSPRVSFAPELMRHGAVDGGWWPRSRNALTEPPGLIAALDVLPGVRVQWVAVHRDEWDDIARKLTPITATLSRSFDWFTTISRHTVSVTTAGGREPIALLVVPPVPARKLPGAPWTQQPPAHATPRPPTSLLPKTFRNAGEYGAKPGDGATREGNSAADA